MKTYHVKVAVRILEIYKVRAEDKETARDLWSEQGGQRTGAGADFEHDVVGPDVGRLDEQPQQVQVDEKILAVARLERNPHVGEPLLEKRNSLVACSQ